MSLFETLSDATTSGRREIIGGAIRGVMSDDPVLAKSASRALRDFSLMVIEGVERDGFEPSVADPLEREFLAVPAARLLGRTARLQAYFRAIERAPRSRTALDVGTGPAAILSLAIAALHSEIGDVEAWEINPMSAECARRTIALAGYEGLIRVQEGDALETQLGPADMGVVEMFADALTRELGGQVSGAMARAGVKHRIPAYAIAQATDDTSQGFTGAGLIDFASDNDVYGTFQSTGNGLREVSVRTLLYDSEDGCLLGPGDRDNLTAVRTLGSVSARRGDAICFGYPLGANLATTRPDLWVVPQ